MISVLLKGVKLIDSDLVVVNKWYKCVEMIFNKLSVDGIEVCSFIVKLLEVFLVGVKKVGYLVIIVFGYCLVVY